MKSGLKFFARRSLKGSIVVIGILAVSLVCAGARARELNPHQRLSKLSLLLRGAPISYQESVELDTIPPEKLEDYFAAKTRQYLRSKQHVAKMMSRLDDLFRLKENSRPVEKDFGTTGAASVKNSLDYLFKDIVQNNRSWDNLLTTRRYFVFDTTDASDSISDRTFFEGLFSNIPRREGFFLDHSVIDDPAKTSSETPLVVSVAPNDDRLAGAITTSRFMRRYKTTNVNKNRRRAAAVFRIFLCDSMTPALNPSADETLKLKRLALLEGPARALPHPMDLESVQEKQHGSDPVCMHCHEKLDPLGKTLDGIGIAMSDIASPGRLFFRRNGAPPVNIPARGIGDLARKMTRLPEYSSCQVKHFWDWFIGVDVSLKDARLQELTAVFNQVGRRPDDFIAYLVNQPEFYTPSTEALTGQDTFTALKPIFARCVSCHGGDNTAIANFTVLPWKTDSSGHKGMDYWINKVAARLNLKNSGERPGRSMPPEGLDWDLSQEDIQNIKSWFAHGAPDENGNPTVNPAAAKPLVDSN